MKKHILLLTTVVLSTFAIAQKTSVTIHGGMVSASMKGEAVNNLNNLLDFAQGMITTNSRKGLYGGVSVDIPLNEMFSVSPGITYAQKGYELRGDLALKGVEFLGANAKALLTTHYIDLPVVLKANINGFQVFAGPQVSYLAKADLKTSAGVLGFNLFNSKLDATEQFNQWDAGVTGGVGYQFKNGFNVSASYDHGLSKTDKNQNMEAYNRAFKVGVGFSF